MALEKTEKVVPLKKKQKIKRMRNHRGLENREGIGNSFFAWIRISIEVV